MATATQEGRRLALRIEGIEDAFLVDPLSARRGKALTEKFIRASLGANLKDGDERKLTPAESEEIFIEALGPSNYSRASGFYIDEFEDGVYLTTWGPDGSDDSRDPWADTPDLKINVRYFAREAQSYETPLDGEPIRQEEIEQLALLAFYWQSVVGMEGVTAILEAGGGTSGSLKALSLLQIRTGLSPRTNSSSPAMESAIRQQAVSSPTSDTPNLFGSARLPANKQGFRRSTKPGRTRRK